MSDLDKLNEDTTAADAPAKRRGRPKKRIQEETEDAAVKKRGRPKKDAAAEHAAPHRERPSELVFALDIGTRSVIGIVAEQRDGMLHILATERMEHKTRAMLDGQIHDVPQVAAIIREVKRRLTERTGALHSAAVAAAGRALYTMTAEAEQDITGIITPAQQRDLDFAGVQAAQRKLAQSHTVDDPTRYYCVGYSTIRYTLDGNDLKTLVGQRGRKAQATVIATFLPRQVVDSMQSALRETHLEMRALTLEPIAGINVLIPPTMRHLNLVLVDIGAGTSDVAITRGGSVIAYGMVPMAGDEITEAISREYLLDFNIAEDIKRKAADGQDVSFTDILGMSLSLTAEQVVAAIKPGVENLAGAIAKQIIELNGEPPQAVMLVGGGALTPMMSELVAEALGHGLPAVPVLLVQRILDGDQRVGIHQFGVVADHLLGGLLRTLELVGPVLVELGSGDVESQGDLLAGFVAGLLDGLDDQVEGLTVGVEVRGEPALVAQAGGQATVVQHLLEGVVDAGTHLDGLGERLGADGGDHELLDVDIGVGVRTAVQDVHHGDGQDVGVGTADVLVQRELRLLRGGVGDGQGDTEDGVGPELGLVRGPVELDHGEVDGTLLVGLETEDVLADDVEHVLDGGLHSLATVAFAAVTQLDGLEGTR